MITRATNRKRRDRNCSSTYWGVPGTAGGRQEGEEAVSAAAVHTAHLGQKSRSINLHLFTTKPNKTCTPTRLAHQQDFQTPNNVRQNKTGIVKVGGITIGTRSPLYPKGFGLQAQ